MAKQCSIEEEYKKNPGITREDIAHFREWVNTQPHLPAEHITDLDLILSYHCCNNSFSVAKEVLDLNLTLKTLFTNFFKDRSLDKKVLTAANLIAFTLLPTRGVDGSAVMFVHMMDSDTKNFVFMDAVRTVMMELDCWQHEQGTWPGFVIAIDMDGVTLGHIARLDIQSLQQFFYYLQEAMLVNLKSFHFLNAPSFMDKVLMLIKPFMKKALLDMLFIHQAGSNTFEKYVPKKALPKELGGDHKDLETLKEESIELMKRHSDFLAQENRKRVVETKRPGKPKTITDIFGSVEGSFKKLDID